MGRVRNRMEEERRRREKEARAFRAALEKISPQGHVDSEGRMKSREVPSATEVASLHAAGQNKEKREKEAMTASFFARSDEERRREEEKGRRLWQLIEQLRKDSQARAGAFGLTDEQAAKVHSAYKQGKKDYALQSERYRQLQQEANRQLPERVNAYAPEAQDFFGLTEEQMSGVHSAYKQGVKDYNLQSEQYRQLIGEANRQVFERGVAYVEQGKEDEKQQQAQIKQAYEKYLPLSEERKASNARREKALTELPQKVIGYMQKEMRKGKDEKYLQEQVMKDVREEGYRGLNALYEAGVRMAQGRENLDQWRHNALMEKEKLLFENPNNEDLIGKEDYEQRVAQGAQFNKFVQGGTDTENIAYGEGWQKSYLTDGSKYLRPEEIDRLSYYLSFSDDPMKKREAQDYYEYLENLGQRRYEYYRFLSGETAKRGGEYGDAFISGGMEDSMQGIVSFLFDKPLSILTDRIAPTHVDTAEQMRYAQDLANETDPIKKLNKQVLQAVGAQVPYMLLGGLTPKMYAGSNIGFKAGKEAMEEWAKINAKDLVRMSQAGYYGSMAASIYGNAEQQALLEGKKPQQAATYALLNTMAEVGLQAVVGRVAGIAGGAMMQHSPLAQSFVNRIAKNPIAQRVTVTLLRTGGENVEEALQMALQPALVNMAYGTNEKLNITKEEVGELVYITTGATLLMNVFSLGLNLKNDIVTIRRDLRLPDNTLLSAEQGKILAQNDLNMLFLAKMKSAIVIENGDFSEEIFNHSWNNTHHYQYTELGGQYIGFRAVHQSNGTWQYLTNSDSNNGHKIYFSVDIKPASSTAVVRLGQDGGLGATVISPTFIGQWQRVSGIYTVSTSPGPRPYFSFGDTASSGWQEHFIRRVVVLDLTMLYGRGLEPATTTEVDIYVNLYLNHLNKPIGIRHGANANGDFLAFPNGALIMWGFISVPANTDTGTVIYPMTATSVPRPYLHTGVIFKDCFGLFILLN